MKYIFLILIAFTGYTFYFGGDDIWTDEELEVLVVQKNEDLCVMSEFLEEYNITQQDCSSSFISETDACFEETKLDYPGDKFETKKQFLEAFNETLSCIAMGMKK